MVTHCRRYGEQSDSEDEKEESEKTTEKEVERGEEEEGDDEMNGIGERVQCMVLHKRESNKRGEDHSWQKHGLWRQEQKNRAARLEKQLKTRWAMEELIDEQLHQYQAHYNRAMGPTMLKNVAQLLMPKWAPPHELAAVSWLGDWRPSTTLDLLHALTGSSSSPLSDSVETKRLLSQLVHEIHIEETVLDEQMAEIQATSILHLPFAPMNQKSGRAAVARLWSEFKKIEQVIARAQQLRSKALELVVKKVLSAADAAEFLVAFAGIQDSIHQFAVAQRIRKGPVSIPVKALGSSWDREIQRTYSKLKNHLWEGAADHSPVRENGEVEITH